MQTPQADSRCLPEETGTQLQLTDDSVSLGDTESKLISSQALHTHQHNFFASNLNGT